MNDINSTDDARVINNTMRHKYRILSDEEKVKMRTIKDVGDNFITVLNDMKISQSPREIALAKTKIRGGCHVGSQRTYSIKDKTWLKKRNIR